MVSVLSGVGVGQLIFLCYYRWLERARPGTPVSDVIRLRRVSGTRTDRGLVAPPPIIPFPVRWLFGRCVVATHPHTSAKPETLGLSTYRLSWFPATSLNPIVIDQIRHSFLATKVRQTWLGQDDLN